jgi:hypothetical protein
MRTYTLVIMIPSPVSCVIKGVMKTKKSPTTIVSSKVSDQEPSYYKPMDWKHVFATHLSSINPYSKVHPYEPIYVK